MLFRSIVHRVHDILAQVGLSAAIWKMPAQLSGGMRRRVALARALIAHPKFVLLDDPTAGLDPVASSVIMDLVRSSYTRLNEPGMIVVSHDLRRLLPVVDRVICLGAGHIVFDGSPHEIKTAVSEVKNFVGCRYDLDRL